MVTPREQQGNGCPALQFILNTEKRAVFDWVGGLDCMAVLYICTPAAELWLLLLHILLQSCARMVKPLGSTALSLMLGMLFSCPRMVEPLGWCWFIMVWYVVQYGVSRCVVWHGIWYIMLVWYDGTVCWVDALHGKTRCVIWYVCGMVGWYVILYVGGMVWWYGVVDVLDG